MKRFRAAVAAIAIGFMTPAATSAENPTLHSVTWVAPSCVPVVRSTAAGAAVLSLLIPKVVEGGIRFIGNALARAGAPRERHVWSRASTSLYSVTYERNAEGEQQDVQPVAPGQSRVYVETPTVGLANRCVIAVFGPRVRPLASNTFAGQVPLMRAPNGLAMDPVIRAAIASHFDLSRTTILVGELESSPDRTAFRIVPQYLEVAGALRDRQLDRRRAVTVAISLLPPGGVEEGAASVVRTFHLADVTTSRLMTGGQAEALGSGWIPLPALPDGVEARLTAATTRRTDHNNLTDTMRRATTAAERERAQADQEELARLIAEDNRYLRAVAPYSFRADLTETTPGNAFLQQLGALLTGNAADLAAPIAAAIDPARRATAAEEEAAAQDNLRIAAIQAVTAFTTARAGDDAGATRVAEIQASGACRRLRAAGYSDPLCALVP